MGRSVVYCGICGGPLENVYNNVHIHAEYDERILPSNMTEVGFSRPDLSDMHLLT